MCVRLPRPDISSEEMEEASKAMGYGAGERAGARVANPAPRAYALSVTYCPPPPPPPPTL